LLSLDLLEHSHTGEVLSMSLEKCLTHWEIPKENVLQIIFDNGANMVKEDEVEDDEEAVDGCDDAADENPLLLTQLPYRRLGCLAHSLRFVIKEVYKGPYSVIIAKTQGLLGRIRKSSVAMEKVISTCGKGVISDNLTYLVLLVVTTINCYKSN